MVALCQTWSSIPEISTAIGPDQADVLSCAERLEELKADVSEKAHSLESFQDSLHATQAQQLPEDIEHEGRNPTFLRVAV
ncbi:unnamed protein product [Cladocopium goreaui]|uniref:Uncharacterized protein n=1 Tax=Cladocopium goreaui TaxID=2562237 RepID=A0A9P1CGD6_9DINO|nr:unnamed protein product [Cladocopium goreaui]